MDDFARIKRTHKKYYLQKQTGINRLSACLIMFSLLLFGSWLSIGNLKFHLTINWLLIGYMSFYYYKINNILATVCLPLLIIMTITALILGYPRPNLLSISVFLCFMGIGLFCEYNNYQKSNEKETVSFFHFLTHLKYAPLFITYKVLTYFGASHYIDHCDKKTKEK